MTTIEEVRQRLQNNGMASQLHAPVQGTEQKAQSMTDRVAEVIKAQGAKLEAQREAVKQGEDLELKNISEKMPDLGAGADARQEPMELDAGDGLQKMIDEAKLQTDAITQVKGVLGGDAQLAKAGQAFKVAVGLLPNVDKKEEWVDESYLNPNPVTDIRLEGRYLPENAGQLMTDNAGESWMYNDRGGLIHVTGKSQAELDQMRQQYTDPTFAITGRVYGLDSNGNTPQWLSVGDQVVTAGGTYVITGHKPEGGYTSMLYDAGQTTANFGGNYNTGTYGSIIGQQNGNADDFRGNRQSAGEFTGYGGYSMNPNGKMQFDTVSHTFDGERTRAAIQDGVAYEMDARGNLKPMEAGSLVQDASQRYWVVGADGNMIDVTPADPMNNPINDPTGEVKRLQREEAKKAGLDLNRKQKAEAEAEAASRLDPVTQAQIDQLQLQLERQQSAAEAANRDLYRQYRLGQERLEDQLVGAGLNTSGVSEKVQAQLTADYLSGMNQNRQQTRTAEEDAAYQIEMAQLMALQEAEAQRKAEAQQKAATLAQYGDFSGYGELGYTPAQIAGMEQTYAAQNAPDTGYKGLSDYAQTLLGLYQANPGYDIKRGLQQALDGGLISQQDYIAALQTAAGMAV